MLPLLSTSSNVYLTTFNTSNMTRPLYSAKNSQEHERLAKEGNVQYLADLDTGELEAPASRWTRRHLLAYRLLTPQPQSWLPILQTEHNQNCPNCNTGAEGVQKLDEEWTKVLMSGCPAKLKNSKDSELLKLKGGFFWAKLAEAIRVDNTQRTDDTLETESDDTSARRDIGRQSRPSKRDGYIDTRQMVVGSSPPQSQSTQLSEGSGSAYQTESDDIDDDDHEARRSKPEEVTLHLMLSFIQHVLNLCLLQCIPRVEVRPRVERKRWTATVAKKHTFTAEDDGGICQMNYNIDGWNMLRPVIALLETKKAFKALHTDESTGKPKPIVSDETLAQYLGEALAAWRSNRKTIEQEYNRLSLNA